MSLPRVDEPLLCVKRGSARSFREVGVGTCCVLVLCALTACSDSSGSNATSMPSIQTRIIDLTRTEDSPDCDPAAASCPFFRDFLVVYEKGEYRVSRAGGEAAWGELSSARLSETEALITPDMLEVYGGDSRDGIADDAPLSFHLEVGPPTDEVQVFDFTGLTEGSSETQQMLETFDALLDSLLETHQIPE